MNHCPYLETCPIFARFQNEGAANIWISTYCQGFKQEECVRKQMKDNGETAPITMLPNGTHLESLGEEEA